MGLRRLWLNHIVIAIVIDICVFLPELPEPQQTPILQRFFSHGGKESRVILLTKVQGDSNPQDSTFSLMQLEEIFKFCPFGRQERALKTEPETAEEEPVELVDNDESEKEEEE